MPIVYRPEAHWYLLSLDFVEYQIGFLDPKGHPMPGTRGPLTDNVSSAVHRILKVFSYWLKDYNQMHLLPERTNNLAAYLEPQNFQRLRGQSDEVVEEGWTFSENIFVNRPCQPSRNGTVINITYVCIRAEYNKQYTLSCFFLPSNHTPESTNFKGLWYLCTLLRGDDSGRWRLDV